MTALLAAIASAVLWLGQLVTRPTSARCARGSWLSHGVRPDGRYTCTFDALADEGDAPAPLHTWRPSIDARIWCAPGASPRQDGARVWCAAGRPTS